LPVFAPWAGRPCHGGVARASCPCLPHGRDAHATGAWHGHPARVCPMGGTPMPRGRGTGILPVFAPWAGRPCHGGVARASCPCLPHGRDAHATGAWHGHPARVCPMGGTPMPRGAWHGHPARVCPMGGTPMPRGRGTGILPVFASWAGRLGLPTGACPKGGTHHSHGASGTGSLPGCRRPMGGTPVPRGRGTGINCQRVTLPRMGGDAHATGAWHGHLARVCLMGGTPMPREVFARVSQATKIG
jgi:hypothetical protein